MPKTKTPPTHHHDHAGHNHDHDHSVQPGAIDSVIGPDTIIPLTLAWKTVEPVYQQTLKTMAKKVKSAGFRQGKVPTKLAEEIIGISNIIEETVNKLLPAAYQDILKTHKLEPLTRPEFLPKKLTMGEDWELEVHIAQKPEVTVKGYEKLAKKGKTEGEKEWQNHQTEHAEHQKTQKLSEAEAATQTESEHKDMQLRFIFRELVTGLKPIIPELLVKEETRAELEKLVKSLNQLKMTLDDYLTRRQMSFEQLSGEVATQVIGQLQLEFILQALAEDTKFAMVEADFETHLNKIEDEKTRAKYEKDPEYRAYLTRVVAREKVVDHLLSL